MSYQIEISTTRDEERSTVLSSPLLDQETQLELYEFLKEKGPWKQRSNYMFGKEKPQPRLGFIVGRGYRYSGAFHEEEPDLSPEVKDKILDIMAIFSDSVGHPINNAVVQYYRDGQDCIFAHSDDESQLSREKDVVSVCVLSLGNERTMTFTAGKKFDRTEYQLGERRFSCRRENEKVTEIPLVPGEVMIFEGDQQHLKHAILRTRQPVGGRISISCRYLK